MRRLASLLLILAFVCAPAVPAAADPKRPTTLREIRRRLDELVRQVQALVVEASKDAAERKIAEYENYSDKQLKKTRGRVRAQDLVAYLVDPEKNFNLRERAQLAILAAARDRPDPDLSTEEKHGTRSKRAHFCKTHLLKHLRHENRLSRALLFGLLTRLWPVNVQKNPALFGYRVDSEATWRPTLKEWDKYLRRK